MKIILATANAHKLREMQGLLAGCDIEVLSLGDFPDVVMPEETGATMAENARLTAQSCAAQTGLPCLADDSGIEVDALDGAPGVRSARWVEGSDEDRTNALLEKLQSTPEPARTARYRCAICLAFPDGRLLQTEATCEGKIGTEFKGENGFGYDPIFVLTNSTGAPSEYSGQTMAEVPPEIKAQVSHRARAIQKLRELL
jgi:XTP/dITP diphosphohydrolase